MMALHDPSISSSLVLIGEKLLAAQKILIASHYHPDPDAFGSSVGLAHGLRSLGKEVEVFNVDGPTEYCAFIPGVRSVVSSIPKGNWDVFVACDCGDERRLGDAVWEQLLQFPVTINIDHHQSNTLFGHLNHVEVDASSTSEIILTLLEWCSSTTGTLAITPEAATALFAGVSADTGSFRYPSTHISTFEAAARLLGYGARGAEIAEALYSQASVPSVTLTGEALAKIQFLAEGRIALVKVTEEMFQRHHAATEDTEDIVERARSIKGVAVAAFFRQEEGVWKVSLRSRTSVHDVSVVARNFGGGGHKCAAGFRWRKELPLLELELLPQLQKLVSPLPNTL